MKKLYHICQKYKKQRESDQKSIGIRFKARQKEKKSWQEKESICMENEGDARRNHTEKQEFYC